VNCGTGGVRVHVGSSTPTYVCNGSTSDKVVVTNEPPGVNCATGGIKLQVGGNQPTYVCDGSAPDTVSVTPELPGPNCEAGGLRVQVGSTAPAYVCNGTSLQWSVASGAIIADPDHGYASVSDTELVVTLPPVGGLKEGSEIGLWALGHAGVQARGPVARVAHSTEHHRHRQLCRWFGIRGGDAGTAVAVVQRRAHVGQQFEPSRTVVLRGLLV
jgi:hypothetical protein